MQTKLIIKTVEINQVAKLEYRSVIMYKGSLKKIKRIDNIAIKFYSITLNDFLSFLSFQKYIIAMQIEINKQAYL